MRPQRPLLSLVLPVYNEVAGLPSLIQSLRQVLDDLGLRHELIFVDDGSVDGSTEWLAALAEVDERLRLIQLSRNFGHQAALQAGLADAHGDAVVVMDSDHQDDPRAIPRFVQEWRAGADVVYAIRTDRKEVWWKRWLFASFYRLLQRIADIPIPLDAGNFGLIDRRVVEALNDMPERTRFFAGLRSWVGYTQVGVAVERQPRYDGRPRVTFWGLCALAKTAIFSFSTAPVSMFYGIAAAAGGGVLICALLAIAGQWQILSVPAGLGSLAALLSLLSLNSLGFAVAGDYLVRILSEVRGRPAYCIARIVDGRRHAWTPAMSRETAPVLQVVTPHTTSEGDLTRHRDILSYANLD